LTEPIKLCRIMPSILCLVGMEGFFISVVTIDMKLWSYILFILVMLAVVSSIIAFAQRKRKCVWTRQDKLIALQGILFLILWAVFVFWFDRFLSSRK
jgi:Ca2+/Na+ antiporter